MVPYHGFSGVVSETLAGNLAKKGHEIIIVGHFPDQSRLFSEEKRNPEELSICFYRMKTISISIPGLITEFPCFMHFEKLIEETRPDIIHINCLPFLTTFQAARVARKAHIPSIVHIHGVTADRGHILNFLQWLYLQSVGRCIFGDTSKVICLTKQDAAQVRSFGCSENKINVIPNGVDVSKFRPNNGGESDGLILWLGRFVPEKGLYYLIKAMSLLANNASKIIESNVHKNYRLLLVGAGPTKSSIEEQIHALHLESMVKIIPAVPHDRVAEYLEQASIFVLPSLKEGMPYTLLEAMASGKPVVGSDISGINDVITNEQNGLLVPPMNPEALANAILELLNDKKMRQRLGQNARQLMAEKYSWDIITSRIEETYNEAIKDSCQLRIKVF